MATRTGTRSSARLRASNTKADPGLIPAEVGGSSKAPIKLTQEKPTSTKKRKGDKELLPVSQPKKRATTASSAKKGKAEDVKSQKKSTDTASSAKKGKAADKKHQEKRLRQFRPKPPQSFIDISERAHSQRFFVLDRQRVGTDDCPGEIVELTGSTGNVYTVNIGLKPTCNCPHAEKGNQCKHVVFVMSKVLNAPYNLSYQLALLSSELCEIFASAPPIQGAETGGDNDKRKPVEGDCPICYSEFGSEKESIVWCRAACGQNMHQECFETWAKSKSGSGDVTCPMCRAVWEGDPEMIKRVEKGRGKVSEGYVNVADQLGISRTRDTSSYSDWYWRRRGGGGGGWRGGYGGRGGWGGRGRRRFVINF